MLGLGLAGLSAVWIVYVAVANLFLNAGGVQRLLEGQNSVELRFDAAFTYWPGEVHVRGYRMVFQDSYVEWSLDLPRAVIAIDLPALADRRFRAWRVRGSGATFRFRHRVDPWDAELRTTEALPPIPEYGRVPLSPATVPKPPISDEEYRLWGVRLDDVDLGLSELWIQQVRYLGDARVRGGFELRPLRTLWVGPATLEVAGGRATVSDMPLAARIDGTITCTMPRFDVRDPEGRSILRHVSGSIALRAGGVRAEPARIFVAPGHDVTIESRPGELDIDARLEKGVFHERSRVELTQPFVSIAGKDLRYELSRAELVAQGLRGGQTEAAVTVAQLELRAKGTELPGPRAERVRISARSSSRDTAGEWRLLEARLEAPELRVPELAWLNELLRERGVRFDRSGSAELELTIVVAGRALSLDAQGAAEGVRLRGPELTAGGKGHFALQTQGDRALVETRAVARLDFEGLFLAKAGQDNDCPFVQARRARLVSEATLRDGRALEVAAAAGQLERASFRVGEVMGHADVNFDVSARQGQAEVPPSFVAHAELDRLELDSRKRAPRGFQVRVPKTKVAARLRERDGRISGAVELSAKRARGRFGEVPVALDLDTKLTLEALDTKFEQATLGASLRVTNASTEVEGSRVEGYWANVDLERARLSTGKNLELAGIFSARLRDGVPGLLLLERGDEVPGWLDSVLPLRELRAQGRIERRCRTTDILLDSVSGGPLEARGRVQATPEGTRGALLVELSSLEVASAGLSFGEPDHGVELLAGEAWLAERSRGLERRRRSELSTACAPSPPACGD